MWFAESFFAKLRIVLFFLLSLGYLSGYADNYFRKLTVADGLKSNTIWCMTQDHLGFIWIGAIDGLYKYDGNQINKIHKDFFSRQNLMRSVTHIQEDSVRNVLWLIVDDSLFTFDLLSEKIKKVTTNLGKPLCIGYYNQYILVSFSEKGVYQYHPEREEFLPYRLTEEIDECSVLRITNGRKGELELLTSDKGVFVYDRFGRVIQTPPIQSPLSFIRDNRGRIWVGTMQGLYLWTEGDKSFRRITLSDKNTVSLFAITDLVEKEPGMIYIATNHGLFVYDTQKETSVRIISRKADSNSLSCNLLNALYVDKEQTLWIATFFGGINYLTENNQNLLSFDLLNQQIEGRVISAFAEDAEQNIWIATTDAGISFWNRKTQAIQNYNPYESNIPFLDVSNIHTLLAHKDVLYIGMNQGGLCIYNTSTGDITKLTQQDPVNALTDNTVFSLDLLDESTIAVATRNGLDFYDILQGKIHHVLEIESTCINKTVKDQSGTLWACSRDSGVFQKIPGEIWINFSKGNKNFPTQSVYTMAAVGRYICFGTRGYGVILYDIYNKRYENILREELKGYNTYTIIPENGCLWIATTNGLYHYRLETKSYQHYTEINGLKSRQMMLNSGLLASDSLLLLGTVNGFNAFKTSSLKRNFREPKTVFTRLRINNEVCIPGKECSPLNKAISYADTLILNYDQRNISLDFASLSYTGWDQKSYKFRYKLFPEYDQWIYTIVNTVNLTNLGIGTHELIVESCNSDGVWDKEGSHLIIEILPPWWLSWYMILLYILLASLFIYWNILKIRRNHQRHIEKIEQKKKEEIYQTKMQFFTQVVHDLRSPLTLIITPIQVLRQREDVLFLKNELDVIYRNCQQMLAYVNQLMDFRKLEDVRRHPIHLEVLDLVSEINNLSSCFRTSASVKGIEMIIENDSGAKSLYINANRNILAKIFNNLISNALKFTMSSILIRIEEKQDYCLVMVEDNGKGMTHEDCKHVFEPFFQAENACQLQTEGTGIGLTIVKDMVEKLGGQVQVKSSLGKGTVFSLSFPLVRKVFSKQEEADEETTCRWNIAVVEDNQDLNDFICSLLRPLYKVYSYSNGDELINDLECVAFDLIVSDVMMPGMDGFSLCRKIKETKWSSHIHVLLLTAKIAEEEELEGLNCGADLYLRKPFSADILLGYIRNMIKNRDLLAGRIRSTVSDFSKSEVLLSDVDHEFFQKLNQIVLDHINDPDLSVSMVARELCVCRTLFFSKVKATTGMTFVEYVRIIRLKKAVELLRSKKYTVIEIVEKTGFSSTSYFYRTFKKYYKMTPSEFIEQQELS